MRSSRTFRALGAAGLIMSAAVLTTGAVAGASSQRFEHRSHHALFVETDQTQNTVVSYVRGADGTVSYAGTYSTGGAGATASGATADPLASQGGVALVDNGRELIAVNPGSDTVSVFDVDGAHLRLTQQISSEGDFPVSVSSYGGLVAVLNSGGTGSVVEYRLHDGRLVALNGEWRSLGLSNTTPPEFHHGAGQVGYSPNGQFLVVTTKLSTDAYDVFTLGHDGQLSATPTVTTSNTVLPFAFNFDAQGHLVGVEAATSTLSVYTINADGSLSVASSVSDNGAALCWVSSANGYFYGSNAGSGTVSSFSESNGVATLVKATAATTHPGTTDSAVSPAGDFLYVESGGSGALDVFAIGAAGALSPVETVWNLPVGFEGIAVS